MKTIKLFLFVLIIFVACNQRKKRLIEQKNNSTIVHYNIIEEDVMVINNLNIIYDSLKPHFRFVKETSLKKVYSYIDKYGYLDKEIGFLNISFEFTKDTTGFELSEYHTFVMGTFMYQNKEFYVFYRGVDAKGYYNGISFMPVIGKKKYTDIRGKMKNGEYSNSRIKTTIRSNKLYFKSKKYKRIKSQTGQNHLFPRDYLEKKEIGYYLVSDDSIVKNVMFNEKRIMRHFRRGSIDTLVYNDTL